MMTAQDIKAYAKELGATVCGIGDIKHFIGDNPQHNPLSILPKATCVIGFGLKVPKGLYEYGITTEEVEQMFLDFCENNE